MITWIVRPIRPYKRGRESSLRPPLTSASQVRFPKLEIPSGPDSQLPTRFGAFHNLIQWPKMSCEGRSVTYNRAHIVFELMFTCLQGVGWG